MDVRKMKERWISYRKSKFNLETDRNNLETFFEGLEDSVIIKVISDSIENGLRDLCLTDAHKLQKYIKTIPVGKFRDQIDALIYGCKVSRATFQNWRYGNCRIPELAKDKIEEISGKRIFQ